MRVSSLQLNLKSLNELLDKQASVSKTQLQVASGKRIVSPSDDPVGATRSMVLRQEMTVIENYVRNGDTAKDLLSQLEGIFSSLSQSLERIEELTIQAGSGSLTRNDRAGIVDELKVRKEEILSLANARDAHGEYIFAGFRSGEAPVRKDSSGKYIYHGDEGQQYLKVGSTAQIPVTQSAKNIFFVVQNENVHTDVTTGLAKQDSVSLGLVNSGSLSVPGDNQLMINDVVISSTINDGVSTSDGASSSIAMALAINKMGSAHNVRATVNPNIVNVGQLTPAVLLNGDLSINGVPIIDGIGTETSLIESINLLESQTGIIASQPGGLGTSIFLTAQDGRNIQLQTTGTSAAGFSNFTMNSGVQNKVQSGTYTLQSDKPFEIGGAVPQNLGLSSGKYPVSLNTGTGVLTSVIVKPDTDINETYRVVFGQNGLTYSVYTDMDANTPMEGFSNIPYSPGETIEVNALQMVINGAPQMGDTFTIKQNKSYNQDLFTTLDNLMNSIMDFSSSPERLSYEIGLGLSNLKHAETTMLTIRASIGASLNVVESQKDQHERSLLLTQELLSKLEDLDYAKAISDLTQASFALEAAQQSFVRIQKLSIFNYL